MTPREMAAWLYGADKLDRVKLSQNLEINALAARGDEKHVKKKLKALQKD